MGTNTGLGIGIGIPFKNNALGGDKPYFPPELKARMIGVWTNYGKKNTDADRNIIKNKIPNAGGDLEILNAAYKLNSGFGEYSEDFTTWTKSSKITSVNSESFSFASNVIYSLLYYKSNIGKDIPSFKIRIKLDKKGGDLYYNYINSEGRFINTIITGEEYVTPVSYNTKYIGKTPVNCGFSVTNITSECSGTITQIPNFEDAFVSDGINDMIVSQKTLQEMGVTKELTIVSMIHQINTNEGNFITINNLRNADKVVGRNIVTNIDKTGIYGWYKENIEKENIGVINNILGDKADYVTNSSSSTNTNPITNSKFYVTGYAVENGFTELSSVAWYWTIIANKVLTTDQINQVIAYFNLDRTLKPDILCNTIKQGITNENHAEFGDKLIDFSGNGRDIQLNNIAWKGDSGIGKYEVDFASLNYNNTTSVFTATYKSCSISKIIKDGVGNIFYNWGQTLAAINSTKIQVIGLDEIGAILEFTYLDESGNSTTKQYSTDGIYDLPASAAYQGDSHNTNFRFSIRGYIGDCDITITQIPSHAGALLLNGGDDFGKVTGMPIYKDYTFIIDYERISCASSEKWVAGVVSKSHVANQGAFILMTANTKVEPGKQAYSFGGVTSFNRDDFTRALLYQSKYKCGDVDLTVGKGVDSDTLWLGTFRDNDQRFFNGAIYSLMSFPYSMSEFLIERQLKKHKLGTLYPDMVEFRPIVKSNLPYSSISYSVNPGEYISVDSMVTITVTLPNTSDKLMEVSCNAISDISISGDNGVYEITGKVVKSPQKINLVISSYLTMLSNSTLILNETLIKNE